jgi:hypothetical protein
MLEISSLGEANNIQREMCSILLLESSFDTLKNISQIYGFRVTKWFQGVSWSCIKIPLFFFSCLQFDPLYNWRYMIGFVLLVILCCFVYQIGRRLDSLALAEDRPSLCSCLLLLFLQHHCTRLISETSWMCCFAVMEMISWLFRLFVTKKLPFMWFFCLHLVLSHVPVLCISGNILASVE